MQALEAAELSPSLCIGGLGVAPGADGITMETESGVRRLAARKVVMGSGGTGTCGRSMLQAGTLDFLAEAAGGEGCPHPTCFLLLSQHSPLPDSPQRC